MQHISFLKCPATCKIIDMKLLKILKLRNEISSLVCRWIKIISSLVTRLRLVTCDEMILIQLQTRDDISFLNSKMFSNSTFLVSLVLIYYFKYSFRYIPEVVIADMVIWKNGESSHCSGLKNEERSMNIWRNGVRRKMEKVGAGLLGYSDLKKME